MGSRGRRYRRPRGKKFSVYFPREIIEEILREAERLDRSTSWVVEQAWKLARRRIKEMH